jgi:23S rRNA pseudouridine2605 synthase
MRLAKLIASRGVCSRRDAEQLILDGRVQVNGDTVKRGAWVVEQDDFIKIDGKPLPNKPPKVYLLMYKPKGTITGRNDPEGRKSVMDLIEQPVRVEPVGRLDLDTEGALLFTNDGDLANALLHPSAEVPKRYQAKVWRTPTDKTLARLRAGVFLPDGKTRPCKARVLEATKTGNAWLEITVTEGRNRLVRRMLQAMNHPVSKLRRESFATLSIREMERGEVRPLTSDEIRRLKALADGRKPAKSQKGFKYRKGFARPTAKKGLGSKRRGVK